MDVVASHYSGFGNANNQSFDAMRKEVNSLREQLSSVQLHHQQKSPCLNREIETMKQNHQRESDEKL